MLIEELLDLMKDQEAEDYTDLEELFESEFDMHNTYLLSGGDRLTSKYYHSWTCTDTKVGIMVYYLDEKPICLSFQSARKANIDFSWLSIRAFRETKEYAISLSEPAALKEIDLLDNDTLKDMLDRFDKVEYKEFEEKVS
jgi:hypothetical protein